jgi:hypothetical protein
MSGAVRAAHRPHVLRLRHAHRPHALRLRRAQAQRRADEKGGAAEPDHDRQRPGQWLTGRAVQAERTIGVGRRKGGDTKTRDQRANHGQSRNGANHDTSGHRAPPHSMLLIG